MVKPTSHPVWDALASMRLTILLLALLMVLVFLCTLAQVDLGTFGAVAVYMRSFLVWWRVPGTGYSVPIFPGGALVGLVLAVNLVAQFARIAFNRQKFGLWLVHLGLILFVVGEFVSGAFQVDSQMAIEVGQTVNYVEGKDQELAVIDVTDPLTDDVYGIRERRLARGGTVELPGSPVSIKIHEFYRNAELTSRRPGDPPGPATAGVGTGVAVRPLAPVSRDDDMNRTAAFVEPVAGGRSYGTWLVSNVLGAPQSFIHEGRTYVLQMRPRRQYLPYSITLKKFSHDVYAGTDIPRNFSSLVRLYNPSRGEDRDVLIFMNQPLRYDGKAFYQASFGKNDTLSILQVVENPGWLLPYVSCVLVTVGLLYHFGSRLRRSLRRREAAEAAGEQHPAAQEA
ncbi:MAG TPA: cytochrome c biogenesis protein ResB [Anaeromyxobacteraceae bacterium]|nr:cytochrome c biogenesis protein ResB [Anaeromyxobacteraceae bacterium]